MTCKNFTDKASLLLAFIPVLILIALAQLTY